MTVTGDLLTTFSSIFVGSRDAVTDLLLNPVSIIIRPKQEGTTYLNINLKGTKYLKLYISSDE